MARKGSVDEGKVAALPPQTVIGLRAEHVKRLSLVDVRFEPTGAVIIGGANEAGKSSLLDSVMFAFGGAAHMPGKPVREGRKEAVIELETQSLRIRRVIKPDGTNRVEVTGKDGLGLGSGQAVLDTLFTDLTFDPLAFLSMKPAAQVEAMRTMTGLDFTVLDTKHDELYAKRRAINAKLEEAQARLNAIPEVPKDTPSTEQDPVALSAALEKATQLHNLRGEIIRKAGELGIGLRRYAESLEGIQLQHVNEFREVLEKDMRRLPMGPNPDEARAALAGTQAINTHVRNKKLRDELALEVKRLENESKNLSFELSEIVAEKEKRTAAAPMPVPGLTFAGDQVLYQGIPFDQASYAIRLRVSFAMAMAMNPKLRVCLIREGAMLDEKNRAALVAMAVEAKAQVLLEVVGERGATLVIEDGAVKGK